MDYDDEAKVPDPVDDMPMYEKTLAQANAGTLGVSALAHRPTITELLQHKLNNLEYEISLVKQALQKAKENQGAMELMDSIAKTRVHG